MVIYRDVDLTASILGCADRRREFVRPDIYPVGVAWVVVAEGGEQGGALEGRGAGMVVGGAEGDADDWGGGG